MRMIHCLPVEVYRFPLGDCTNGGVSSFCDELLVACESGHRTFDADKEMPLNFCAVFQRYGIAYLCPADVCVDGTILQRPGWWMFGGNIADSSDSRWHELIDSYYPLHIHDRKE